MRKQGIFFFSLFLFCCQIVGWTNSINLFNNSDNRLQAVILSADGKVLSEIVLNPRDAMTWSDSSDDFGLETNQSSGNVSYTVNWYCMAGQLFGTCDNVMPGSVVLSMSCQGDQQCPDNPVDESINITPSQ